MLRELKIDQAVYLVDDETRTYCFLRRNPAWEKLDPAENEENKRQIDGYTRLFRDGRRKTFKFRVQTGRFRDVNAVAVAASRGVSTTTLINRFQEANRRLLEIYQLLDPREVIIEIKVDARLRTLAQLVPEAEAHIRHHHRKLRKSP